MWKSFSSRTAAPAAWIPEKTRIYAIGDVHGRADLLSDMFRRIDMDLRNDPIETPIQVLLGDYVDRGLQSREVIDLLIARRRSHQVVCLKGNHEVFATEFIEKPGTYEEWRRYGGLPTLISYGVIPPAKPGSTDTAKLAADFAVALPPEHRRFLADLAPFFECGDFFFVHAGVRPGIELARQDEHDLLWIREEFLLHEDDYSKVIVHGHTAVTKPDIRSNRINIDTGAYATGRLTCLVLEGDELEFL